VSSAAVDRINLEKFNQCVVRICLVGCEGGETADKPCTISCHEGLVSRAGDVPEGVTPGFDSLPR
jgi:hypothetical protein